MRSVMAAHSQAVVVVGPCAPVAGIVKKAHAAGWRPQFLTVSFVGTEEFIRKAGADAEGTILTQVVAPTIAPIIRRLRSIASICRSIIGTQRRVM
jgi:branched-chain amino acid transport system substrate-binding protein